MRVRIHMDANCTDGIIGFHKYVEWPVLFPVGTQLDFTIVGEEDLMFLEIAWFNWSEKTSLIDAYTEENVIKRSTSEVISSLLESGWELGG